MITRPQLGIDPIKSKRLNTLCEQHDWKAILFRRRSDIAWLTDGADVHVDLGSENGVGMVFWFPDSMGRKPRLVTDNIERERLIEEERFDPEHWEIVAPEWWSAEASMDWRLHSTLKTVGIDASDCGADNVHHDCLQTVRTPLTDREIATVRSLGADAARIMAEALTNFVKPGLSELEIAGRLAADLRALGILTPVMLVASDDRLRKYRHPIPTGNRVRHTVMVAICAQRLGLTVSISRLVHFGSSLPDDLKRRHEAVCRVDRALHAATRVGRSWGDCLADGIAMYEQCGFEDEWRKHHQGGPMGYDLRDFKATPGESRTVQPSQLVGWNPSITGTKSEDTILTPDASSPAGGGGCEVVTSMPDWPVDETTGRPAVLVRSS